MEPLTPRREAGVRHNPYPLPRHSLPFWAITVGGALQKSNFRRLPSANVANRPLWLSAVSGLYINAFLHRENLGNWTHWLAIWSYQGITVYLVDVTMVLLDIIPWNIYRWNDTMSAICFKNWRGQWVSASTMQTEECSFWPGSAFNAFPVTHAVNTESSRIQHCS